MHIASEIWTLQNMNQQSKKLQAENAPQPPSISLLTTMYPPTAAPRRSTGAQANTRRSSTTDIASDSSSPSEWRAVRFQHLPTERVQVQVACDDLHGRASLDVAVRAPRGAHAVESPRGLQVGTERG